MNTRASIDDDHIIILERKNHSDPQQKSIRFDKAVLAKPAGPKKTASAHLQFSVRQEIYSGLLMIYYR